MCDQDLPLNRVQSPTILKIGRQGKNPCISMSYNKEFVMRGMKFNSVKNQILTGYSGEIGVIKKVENKLHTDSVTECKSLYATESRNDDSRDNRSDQGRRCNTEKMPEKMTIRKEQEYSNSLK